LINFQKSKELVAYYENKGAKWWESNSRCACICYTTMMVPVKWQTQHFIWIMSPKRT